MIAGNWLKSAWPKRSRNVMGFLLMNRQEYLFRLLRIPNRIVARNLAISMC